MKEVDLTKIETPIGLLPKEVLQKLRMTNGPYQRYYKKKGSGKPAQWWDVGKEWNNINWDLLDAVIRLKEAPRSYWIGFVNGIATVFESEEAAMKVASKIHKVRLED